ncbi:MAG: large repetitive protein, partial [Acidimicrobiaceae bacterium]|nr:large repetitive protein [Acidimicrobiaceae bacterium]
MPRPARAAIGGLAKALAIAMSVSLVATLVVVGTPTAASAAGTVLFQNLFNNKTVDGTGTVTVPTPTSGTNGACLTASGNSATPPLLSCAGSLDQQGSGKLRLTPATANQVGGVFGQGTFPTSGGVDVTFNSYQWGGTGADGLAFVLAAVDPANPVVPTEMGPPGAGLGYAPAGSAKGLDDAYLGVGFDVLGDFSSSATSGSGCTNPPTFSASAPGSVVVRGPGKGPVGYCGLVSTYDGTVGSRVALEAATRAGAAVPVEVLVNPTTASLTSNGGVSVAAGTYKVVFTPVAQSARTLTGALPAVANGVYKSQTWLNANGVPKQLAFGFVGTTGSSTDVHEISNAKVLTFNPVPQLAVSTTSYAPSTSQPGGPVNYLVTASVLAGVNETAPISVTQAVPSGVVAVGAYGTGWVCAAPVGQAVTCTTSGSSFSNGTTLPVITVVAIATGTGVTSAVIQTSSPTTASSADANPATNSSTTAGTLPAAPSGIVLVPAIGPIAGGGQVTSTGSSTVAPTAVEIGTTAEQQAGTPVTLFPCPGAAAPGCFTISGNTAVISSMPSRASAASVTVTWVTLGVAGGATYVYADKPAAPATPT